MTVFPVKIKNNRLQHFCGIPVKIRKMFIDFALLDKLRSRSIALVFHCAKTKLIGKDEVFLGLLYIYNALEKCYNGGEFYHTALTYA